jgi:hypothetical protein
MSERMEPDDTCKLTSALCQYCGDYADSSNPDNFAGDLVASCFPCSLAGGNRIFDSLEAKRAYILAARGITDTTPVLPKTGKVFPPKPRIRKQASIAEICVCNRCQLRFADQDAFDLHSNMTRGECDGPFPFPRNRFVQRSHGVWAIRQAA